jgi:PIN domain nuclease of toxin-antitoxin system
VLVSVASLQDFGIVAIEQLPRLHADPFDRLLIRQTLPVSLRLTTHDDRLARYSNTVIVV